MKTRNHPFLTGIVFLTMFLSSLFTCGQKPAIPFEPPGWSRNATIYEVNVRQFTPEGTFRALKAHLPRLQQMGVRILWLMPIHPIGEVNRKGTLGSYYSVRDYYGINPEFGTLEDFKELVSEAHGSGMYVIIDWVANHTAWDHPLIAEHPGWYLKDSANSIISPVADWSDVAGLDYRHPELWEYMIDALRYWINECDIDGYRCDVAGMLPVGFWNRAVPELKREKHLFMLAEWETPELHDTAFDATYSWDFYHLMNRIAGGKNRPGKLDSLLKAEGKTYPPHAYRMRFTSNHDENSWNGTEFERLGEGARAFAVLTFTFPGIPLIYSGQEAAMDKRLSFFDKDTIRWNNYLFESFYSALIHLRLDHPVLDAGDAGGAYRRVRTTRDSAVFAFLRKNQEEQILVVLNLSPLEQDIRLKGKEFPGEYLELFTQKKEGIDKRRKLILRPWEYRVYLK